MTQEDQGQGTAQSKQPEISYRDGFDSKWEEFMGLAKETVSTTDTKASEKADEPCNEEPCKEARRKAEADAKVKTDAERKPYRVLKVQGKEVPVYSEQELVDMAQMGVDYTKKRQADADDRRQWETEYEKKHGELSDLAEKYKELVTKIRPGGMPASETEQAARQPEQISKKSIYEEYGIDPDYADPFQKKMIEDITSVRQENLDRKRELDEVKQYTNIMIAKDAAMNLGKIIKDEREKYPIDEIMSEDGTENLTQKQFASMIVAKHQQAQGQGKKADIGELAREVVRDLHYIQSKSKTVAAPDISNELTPEQFAAKYPDLFKKVTDKIKGQAVADYEKEQSNLPPSLESRKHEVDISKIDSKKKLDNLNDYIDEGFNTPEMRALFSGG